VIHRSGGPGKDLTCICGPDEVESAVLCLHHRPQAYPNDW